MGVGRSRVVEHYRKKPTTHHTRISWLSVALHRATNCPLAVRVRTPRRPHPSSLAGGVSAARAILKSLSGLRLFSSPQEAAIGAASYYHGGDVRSHRVYHDTSIEQCRFRRREPLPEVVAFLFKIVI